MTKLKLNFAQEAGEILTREELKKVLGGTGSGSGSMCKCNQTLGVTVDENGCVVPGPCGENQAVGTRCEYYKWNSDCTGVEKKKGYCKLYGFYSNTCVAK